MLHAYLVNMGSPGTYPETLSNLFTANGLTPIVIPHNLDSTKIFGILPGEKCHPSNFKINTEVNKTQQKTKEPEFSALEVQFKATEVQVLPGTGTRNRSRDPCRQKMRHREQSSLCTEVPTSNGGLALRVLSTDMTPKIANVFKPRSKRDRPQSVLQFHDSWDVNPGMQTDLEGTISEADVEFMFLEGLIQDYDYETVTVDSETLRKARPGLSDSFERGIVEPSPKVLLITKE